MYRRSGGYLEEEGEVYGTRTVTPKVYGTGWKPRSETLTQEGTWYDGQGRRKRRGGRTHRLRGRSSGGFYEKVENEGDVGVVRTEVGRL